MGDSNLQGSMLDSSINGMVEVIGLVETIAGEKLTFEMEIAKFKGKW